MVKDRRIHSRSFSEVYKQITIDLSFIVFFMVGRLVRDASGGFSFFRKNAKIGFEKIFKTEILSTAPEPSEVKMHPNPALNPKKGASIMVAASAVEVHLGLKSGCYAQGGRQVWFNLVSENLR